MALPVPKVALRGGNVFETAVSALVVLVAIGFVIFMMQRTGTGHLGSYPLRIRVGDASGLGLASGVGPAFGKQPSGASMAGVTATGGLALTPISIG